MTTKHNTAFEGSNLTFAERGLLAYALAKPNTYRIDINDVMREGGIGRVQAYTIVNGLLAKGYAKRIETRNISGKFTGTIWRFYDKPTANTEKGLDAKREL